MAQAPRDFWNHVIGEFKEKDHGHSFNFMMAEPNPFDMPHKVFVGPNGEYRYANVKKTVAHIVVDEDWFLNPVNGAVVEKWQISMRWQHDPKSW